MGLMLVPLLVWIVWGRRRFKDVWWIHPSFTITYLALLICLSVTLLQLVPIVLPLLGYVVLVGGLLYWAYIQHKTSTR